MTSRTTAKFRLGSVAALVGVALIVAACGSSSSTSSGAPAANSSASSSAAPATASGISIKTAKGTAGTYLTGPSGRAVYLWVADRGDMSSCSGACAKAWPPVTTKSAPTAATGVNASDLATIARADGTKQVTYKGHPLYYFVDDSGAGMTTGQGSDNFGAKWWLVGPSGAAISAKVSSSGSSNASASTGGAYGGSSNGGY